MKSFLISLVLAVFPLNSSKTNVYSLDGQGWRVQSESELKAADGAKLSQRSFDDGDWLKISVPSSVVASYTQSGELAEPTWSDNIFSVPMEYIFPAWYRVEFIMPSSFVQERTFLNLERVEGCAELWLNGKKLDPGRKIDVTSALKGKNALAIRIESSRLDAGITGSVYFTSSSDVAIGNVDVKTSLSLPDTTQARVSISAELVNYSRKSQKVLLKGKYAWMPFTIATTLSPGQSGVFTTAVELDNPTLWWPNGYGQQHLYEVSMTLYQGNKECDRRSFSSAVRDVSLKEDTLKVNGKRVQRRGTYADRFELLSRYDFDYLESVARYQREQNFNSFFCENTPFSFEELALKYGFLLFDDDDFCLVNEPVIPEFESLAQMMDSTYFFPVDNYVWDAHVTDKKRWAELAGAVNRSLGDGGKDALSFCKYGQLFNYRNYQKIADESVCRSLVVNHPYTTSICGTTYDYFLNPSAAFYACRKAGEMIHVQYSDGKIRLVNRSSSDMEHLKVGVQWFDLCSKRSEEMVCEASLKAESVKDVTDCPQPFDGAALLVIGVYQGDEPICENSYVLWNTDDQFQSILEMPKATLRAGGEIASEGDEWEITYYMENLGDVPAIMLHPQIRDRRGDRVLPVYWSDNYVNLPAGAQKTLKARVSMKDCPELPQVSIEGFNL